MGGFFFQGYHTKLGVGFKHFYFHPYLGKISILTNIFQWGWNHQLEKVGETIDFLARNLWTESFCFLESKQLLMERLIVIVTGTFTLDWPSGRQNM